MPAVVHSTPGYDTWTAPLNIYGNITLIMRGYGGNGQGGNGSGLGGQSGGGGAYVRYTFSVTPGATYTIYNGTGDGDNTWFDSPSTHLVKAANGYAGGVADSPGTPDYNVGGYNGVSSGAEPGAYGGDAGNEPGGPAIYLNAGSGGSPDSGNGGAYGGGGASGGSYYYDNPIYDNEDPPNQIGSDTGYTDYPGGAGGAGGIEIQWITAPPVQATQQYIEVFLSTPPGITQQYIEVFGEVLPPSLIDLSLQLVAVTSFDSTFDAGIAFTATLHGVAVEHFTHEATYGSEINLTLDTVPVTGPGVAWGQIYDLDLSLQEVVVDQFDPATGIDVTITPSLYTIPTDQFLIQFGTAITVDLQEVNTGSFTPMVITDINIDPSLDTVDTTVFPVETTYGAEVNLGLQWTGLFDATNTFLVYPIIFTPHPGTVPGVGHFAEPSRSSSSVIVYGTEPGPFKLNVAASVYRRNGRSHVVHLAPVKPLIVENYVLFDMLSPSVELSINEFNYQAPGGYLRIWNDVVLLSNIVPEGANWNAATAAIYIDPLTPQVINGMVSATTFLPPRIINTTN